MSPMRHQCPKCGKTGFVRVERVVKGTRSHHLLYCGACDHSWQVADDTNRAAPANRSRPESDDNK